MILCCDAGPGAGYGSVNSGPAVHRANQPSGFDSVGGWRRSLLRTASRGIYEEDPHADVGDDLVMSIRSRSAASNVRKCLIADKAASRWRLAHRVSAVA